jgi:uncharacterized membrane protein YraQ (UPF0718 family)
MKYLGVRANKILAYGVASVSGTLLAVFSCTFCRFLPESTGWEPAWAASAFLYSGPAINVLAIVLTARVLGIELGIARAVGAILFSIVIGLLMHLIFRKEENQKVQAQRSCRRMRCFAALEERSLFRLDGGDSGVANWGKPDVTTGVWAALYSAKWGATSLLRLPRGVLVYWFELAWWKIALIAAATTLFGFFSGASPDCLFCGVIGLSIFTSTDKGATSEWFSATWDSPNRFCRCCFWRPYRGGIIGKSRP